MYLRKKNDSNLFILYNISIFNIKFILTTKKSFHDQIKMVKEFIVCGEEGGEINWHYGAISCVACAVFINFYHF